MKKVISKLTVTAILVTMLLNTSMLSIAKAVTPENGLIEKNYMNQVMTTACSIKNEEELKDNKISFPATLAGANKVNVSGETVGSYKLYYQWVRIDNPLWNAYRDILNRKQNNYTVALGQLMYNEKNVAKRAKYETQYKNAKKWAKTMYDEKDSFTKLYNQYENICNAYNKATGTKKKQYEKDVNTLATQVKKHPYYTAMNNSYNQLINNKINCEQIIEEQINSKWITCTNNTIDITTAPEVTKKTGLVCWVKLVTNSGKVYYDYRTFTKSPTQNPIQFCLNDTDFSVEKGGMKAIYLPDGFELETVSNNEEIITTYKKGNFAYICGQNPGITKLRIRTEKDETGANGNLVQVFNVTVTPAANNIPSVPSVALSLNATTASVNVGGSVEITAITTGTTSEIIWTSSNNSIATVRGSGNKAIITGVAKGTAIITATVNGVSRTCTITVNEVATTPSINISLNNTSLNMKTGEQAEISATKTGTTDAIIWGTTNKNVVAIKANGDKVILTAIGEGQAAITATIGNVTKTCNVIVTANSSEIQKPTIVFDKTSLDLKIGDTQEITATKTGTTDNISWFSSNQNVVTVTGNGDRAIVKAVGKGTAVVTAKVGNAIVTCNVIVNEVEQNIPQSSLKLESSKFSLSIGATYKINAITTNTTEKVVWSSNNNNVATVTQDGIVTGIGKGTAIITAQLGNLKEECEVTVEEKKQEPNTPNENDNKQTLVLGTTNISMTEGGNMKIEVTTNSKEQIKWSSSNEKVATVDENGVVTAVGEGTAIITAQLGNLKQTCEVNVKSKQDIVTDSEKKQEEQTSGQKTEKKDTTIASGKMPQTGVSSLIVVGIIASTIMAVVCYRRYKKIK